MGKERKLHSVFRYPVGEKNSRASKQYLEKAESLILPFRILLPSDDLEVAYYYFMYSKDPYAVYMKYKESVLLYCIKSTHAQRACLPIYKKYFLEEDLEFTG